MAPFFFSGRCSHLLVYFFFLRSLAAFLRWAGSVLKETLFARRNSKRFPSRLQCEITPLLFIFGIYVPFVSSTCTKKCLLFVSEISSKAVKRIPMKISDQEKTFKFGGAPVSGWTLTFHVLKIKAKGLSLIIRQPTMSCRLLLLLSIRVYTIYSGHKSLYEETSCLTEVWPIKGFF